MTYLSDISKIALVLCQGDSASTCALLMINSTTGANLSLSNINYGGAADFAPGFYM